MICLPIEKSLKLKVIRKRRLRCSFFLHTVVDRIDLIIRPFGLEIYNANIAELTDLDANNRYFAEQKLRALQIVNQVKRNRKWTILFQNFVC